MRIDSIQLSEGSKISNLVVDSGTDFPASPNEGELFYKTTDDLLYVYDGSQWKSLAGVVSVSGSGGTTGLTLTGGPITSSGTLTLGGTLAVANGGTGTTTAFTAGSVVFAGVSGVYSQNNSALFWDNSNSRLGIGTSSPGTKLDIRGGSEGSNFSAISIDNSAAGAGTNTVSINFSNGGAVKNSITGAVYGNGYLAFATDNNTEKMRLTAGGNLGIGTSSPLEKLHVAGNIQQANANYLQGTLAAGIRTRLFGLNSSDVLYIGSIDASHTGGTVFVKGGTTQMTLDASGNLGIGTSSPAVKLEVSGTSSGSTLEVLRLSNAGSGASTQAQMKFMASSTNYGTISGGYGASAPQMTFDLPNATPGNYVWQVASAEKMRLDTSGNLGIGTGSPVAKLQVVASTANIRLEESGAGAKRLEFSIDNTAVAKISANQSGQSIAFETVGDERMRIDASGNLGIGTTSPGVKLHVVGAIKGDGNDIQNYVGANGVTTSTTNSGLLLQNSTVLNNTGAANKTLVGVISAPQGSHDATAGVSTISVQGFASFPAITSSAATSQVSSTGIVINTQRSYAADTSSATNSSQTGVSVAVGHASTLATSANTNNVSGLSVTGTMSAGTMNNIYSGVRTAMGANPTSGSVTIGAMAPAYLNTSTIGTGAGTATVSSYYGLTHVGLTVGANGTVTNAYELYLGGITNSGTITNPYAMYQVSTTLTNYFGGKVGIGSTAPVNKLDVVGSFGRGAPVTKTSDFSVGATENWLINNKSGSTCTVTLPTASSWTGREIMIKTVQAQAVVSASSNVVPLDGTSAGTAILAATAGKWATLVSDGTNWIIMQAN